MRRTSWFTAGTLLSLAVLAGCRDGVVSPSAKRIEAPAAVAPAPMSLAPQGRPTLLLGGELPDSASVEFWVGPSGGVFFTGNHAVVFPAQSVCDPALSSYGPGTWDDQCTPLQVPLKVRAEVRRANGVTSVEFTPALRFVPSASASRWVWMLMYSPSARGATGDLGRFNIYWRPTAGSQLVDETLGDPSVRTYVDTFLGLSIRRLKHFSMYESGYGIGAGKTCDPAVETCE